MGDAPHQDMQSAKKQYILNNDWAEIDRMTHQHEWVKASAGGLITAPINLAQRRLRVLDSATADGIWLKDARAVLSNDAEFVGFDIAPELYPPPEARPPNVQLLVHDLLERMPQIWQNSFDLVHQRFIFPSFSDQDMTRVLDGLISCVKPGGWIQIVEPDATARVSDPRAKAFDLMQKISGKVMRNPSPGVKVLEHFQRVGLQSIGFRAVDMQVGRSHENKEIGIRGRKNFQAVLGQYMGACSPNDFGVSEEEWKKFPAAFEADTSSYQTAIRQNFIWARKPLKAGHESELATSG